ncbi:MAG: efflux RND transporter periplasmic adaptor subunit [Acidobacteria bacterium]|nr:efflux RND transporter periplasmic adaptor subunit [Acidobacteriota bacterium]
MNNHARRRIGRRISFWLVVLMILALSGVILYARWAGTGPPAVPSTEVRSGDFIDYIELRGEITVGSSTMISAPYNAGDLQILRLVRDGTQVRAGDVVVEFDPSTLRRTADQSRAALKQVEAEVARLNAQQRLADEQVLTEIMSARFGLERAQLDASTRDVISAIENEKNLLAVGKAEQKLRELEAKSESRRTATEADMVGIIRRRDKARADLEQAERNLAALILTSPMDGMITLLPNSRTRTNILGGTTPVFKEGDRIWAGAAIAEIPDMSTIRAVAPVSEAERGRISVGQPVTLHIEAVPDKEHKGVIGEVSPLAKADYTTYPIRKSFDVVVTLDNPDARLRAGMTATFRIEIERLPDSIVVPPAAVFEKGGRLVAYVLEGNAYRERPVSLARRGRNQLMLSSGLKPGDRIALQDPTLSEQEK